MLWWEARIKLDPEDYQRFVPELERMWAGICRGDNGNGHGAQWDAQRHEVLLFAIGRWDVMSPARWLMAVADSAQIHLEQRCYRTTDVPPSPWAPPCECPPGTHPGQSPQSRSVSVSGTLGCRMPDWAG